MDTKTFWKDASRGIVPAGVTVAEDGKGNLGQTGLTTGQAMTTRSGMMRVAVEFIGGVRWVTYFTIEES